MFAVDPVIEGRVACRWCAHYTRPGAACEQCGSPLGARRREDGPEHVALYECAYCREASTQPVCADCRAALAALGTLAEQPPEQPV